MLESSTLAVVGQELPVAGPAEPPFNRRLNFESCQTANTNFSARAAVGTYRLLCRQCNGQQTLIETEWGPTENYDWVIQPLCAGALLARVYAHIHPHDVLLAGDY